MTQKPQTAHYLLYDLFAPMYDLGVWLLAVLLGGEGRLREKTVEEAGVFKGARLLEIFAGTATLSLLAAERGAISTAVDLSPGMLDVARIKARKSRSSIELTRADAASLPFMDASFDRVLVSMGLHETAQENVPVILKESLRVLKPGGRLVIFDFYKAEGAAGFIQKVFFIFVEGDTARVWINTDLQALLNRLGFKNFRRKFLIKGAFQLLSVEKR